VSPFPVPEIKKHLLSADTEDAFIFLTPEGRLIYVGGIISLEKIGQIQVYGNLLVQRIGFG
jgi:hypothetical protein